MKIGTLVTCIRNGERDYTDEGDILRRKFSGQTGRVEKAHDSHGECYTVKFEKGTATFDPDEMTPLAFLTEKEEKEYREIFG